MLNKNQSNKRNSWKYTVVIPALIAFVFLFQVQVVAQEKEEKNPSNAVSAIAIGYSTDKNATDAEMKMDTKTIKEQLGIEYKFSKVKRNSLGEIIAIKIEYKTKEGKSGKIELDSDNPIEPIYFNADGDKVGFSKNGFHNLKEDNNNSVGISYDEAINIITLKKDKETQAIAVPENSSVSFISHNINNDDIVVIRTKQFTGIKVPGEPTLNLEANPLIIIDDKIVEGNSNKIMNNLDPNEIESINFLKDDKAIKYYGDKGKNGVIIIVTKNYYKSKPNNNPENLEEIEFDLNSDYNVGTFDLPWRNTKEKFSVQMSDIKRNNENKIIAITMIVKSENGKSKSIILNQENPIKTIKISLNKISEKILECEIKQTNQEIKY